MTDHDEEEREEGFVPPHPTESSPGPGEPLGVPEAAAPAQRGYASLIPPTSPSCMHSMLYCESIVPL